MPSLFLLELLFKKAYIVTTQNKEITIMGFDLGGLDPVNKDGEHFRNNVWWWRKLWEFTTIVCADVMTPEDVSAGHYNDCKEISAMTAKMMVERLETAVRQKEKYIGIIEAMEADYLNNERNLTETMIQELLEIKPDNKKIEELKKAKKKLTVSSHPFDWENVERFLKFIKSSGGFYIS